VETRRGLPGDPDDAHSRYIEAAIDGMIVGCLYLPNGNPAPGPSSITSCAGSTGWQNTPKACSRAASRFVLAGDYNIMPTDLDVYAPERWVDDALFRPEVREAYRRLVAQGWTDALREQHPGERIYTFWKYFSNAFGRDAGLPHRSSAAQSPHWRSASPRPASTVTFAAVNTPAIMRPPGSNLRSQ
jgi:exodeoxyribonuclease-3